MPFLPLPAGAQVELVFSLFDQPLECTFTFIEHVVTFPPELDRLTSTVLLWWRDNVLPLLSHDLFVVRNVGRRIHAPDQPPVSFDVNPPLQGGLITGALSANVAVRVRYKVVNPPGHRRGCAFVPGVPSNQVAGSHINPVWANQLRNGFIELIDMAERENWRWVVESKFAGGQPRSIGVPLRVDIIDLGSLVTAQRRKRLHNQVLP